MHDLSNTRVLRVDDRYDGDARRGGVIRLGGWHGSAAARAPGRTEGPLTDDVCINLGIVGHD